MVKNFLFLTLLVSFIAVAQISAPNATQGSGTSSSNAKGILGFGLVSTSAPSYSDATINGLSLDALGNLRTITTPSGTWNVNVTNSSLVVSPTGIAQVNLANTGSNSNPILVGGNADGVLQAVSMTASTKAISVTLADTKANAVPVYIGVNANGSISGVSATTDGRIIVSGTVALNPNQSVNIGNYPSLYNGAITGVSTTEVLGTSLKSVSTTDVLRVNVQAVSTTLNVAQSGTWGNSITGVSTTTPLIVNQGTNPWLVSGTVAINPNQSIIVTSATISTALPTGTNSIGQVTANAGTNLNTSAISGTVALNPNQTVLTTANTTSSSSSTGKVTLSGASFSFLTSNTARKSLELINTSDVTCWAKKGTTATSSTGIVLLPYSGYYNFVTPVYNGAVDVICSGVNTTGSLTAVEE